MSVVWEGAAIGREFAEAAGVRQRWNPANVRIPSDRVGDLASRAGVGLLFAFLSVAIWTDFVRTGHVTGLLLLASESLVMILTILHRRTQVVDRSRVAVLLTAVSMIGPPLLRPSGAPALLADQATAFVSALGLAIVIYGKVTLGRSFGLIPANRGVVTAGPYGLVRHPIYTGYLITHIAFVAAHPTLVNVAVLAIGDAALVARALLEERVLAGDGAYREYCSRVAWHLVPGVF